MQEETTSPTPEQFPQSEKEEQEEEATKPQETELPVRLLRHGRSGRQHRSRHEIIAECLKVARNGALKTQLMYGANLSFPMSVKYLDLLCERGLLAREPQVQIAEEPKRSQHQIYKTTEKGVKFLEAYDSLRSRGYQSDEQDT